MNNQEMEEKLEKMLKVNPPYVGEIVLHLSPRSQKPVMAALICAVRTSIEDVKSGSVDIHVFHPNSSGTNIVYGVKFSDKMQEGCWWRIALEKAIEKHLEEDKKQHEQNKNHKR